MTSETQSKSRLWGAVNVLVISLLYSSLTPSFVSGQSEVKGGYYVGGSGALLPSSGLNATLFTHLIYAFVFVNGNDSTVSAPNDGGEMAGFPAKMKSINSDVLTLISISVTGAEFATVLQSDDSQMAFINSSISLARTLQFDGLDLDWEFARSQDEMDAFGLLIGKWRQAVAAEAEKSNRPALLLTAAVYYTSELLYTGNGTYPISAIAQNLDFVNIMCYDFHGSWDVTHTGANANLYDPQGSVLSADYGIMSWLDAGLPPDKAVLGLTLYGRSWILSDENTAAGLNAPAVAAGPPQTVSHQSGVFYYFEVANWIETSHATVVHDNVEVTGYAYANNLWVSYEDTVIIPKKVQYAKSKSLRGYFFWAVSYDRQWEVSTAASLAMDNGVGRKSSHAVTTTAALLLCGLLLI